MKFLDLRKDYIAMKGTIAGPTIMKNKIMAAIIIIKLGKASGPRQYVSETFST